MNIGGVLLAAGMQLMLRPGDYLGATRCQFLIDHVVEIRQQDNDRWVILAGMEQPLGANPWRAREVQVRVSALSRSLLPWP